LLAYGGASLLHFAHNAAFLVDYPNMPAWLSAQKILTAWLILTAVGAAGYLLVCKGRPLIGLSTLAVYAAFGFDGFAHYGLAPFAHHTSIMHLTIWLEATTAAVLLAGVLRRITHEVAALRAD
jgi:hypothetical protein